MVSCHWWREGRLAPRVPAALIAFFASRFAALLVCCSVVAAAVHAQAPRVTVNEVAVTGNTLLPPEQLDAALARFRGELTLDDLKQAAQTVQALYRQAGYGSVVAYVPEQSVAGGRATIAVVEGRITRVHVVGNNQFSEANILRSLPSLKTGVTPRISQIDNEIQLANENPAKQMSLTLEPGQGAGEVDARVVVVEQQPSSWTFALDNTGNESTGMLRAYLRYQNAALWDLDHVLSLQVGTSVTEPSSAYAVAANYRIPFYKQGMTVDLFAAYSKADAGTTFTPAGGLQFSGNGEVLGLLLNKYLQRVGEFEQQLGLGLDLRLYLNDCRIEGLPSAACGSSGESVTVNPLSLSYRLQRGGSFPLGLSIGFSQNLGLAGPNGSEANFEAVRAGAPKYYWLGRLGGFGGMPLPEQWQLQARFSGQFTPDALVWGARGHRRSGCGRFDRAVRTGDAAAHRRSAGAVASAGFRRCRQGVEPSGYALCGHPVRVSVGLAGGGPAGRPWHFSTAARRCLRAEGRQQHLGRRYPCQFFGHLRFQVARWLGLRRQRAPQPATTRSVVNRTQSS
jgi:hemolysin activation/secretion protein